MRHRIICKCKCVNSIYSRDVRRNVIIKCRKCQCVLDIKKYLISTNKNTNKDLVLENKSSLLKLIEAKKSKTFKLRCNVCTKESSGDIIDRKVVCAYCKSHDVVIDQPISFNERGRSIRKTTNSAAATLKFKKIVKLEMSIRNLYKVIEDFNDPRAEIILEKLKPCIEEAEKFVAEL